MKIYSVDPHYAELDNYITIRLGAKVENVSTQGKTIPGLKLGYFTPRLSDEEGSELNAKFLRVRGAEIDEVITNISLQPLPQKNIFAATKLTPEEDQDTDCCAIYLVTDNAQGRAKFSAALELRKDHIFLEGRCFANNLVHHAQPDERRPFCCCPAVLVVNDSEPVQFTYFNETTRSSRIVTLVYKDGELSVAENNERPPRVRKPRTNTPYNRFQRNDQQTEVVTKISRPKNISSFGNDLANLLDDHPEFSLRNPKQRFRNDRNNRARRRALAKDHRRYED